MTSTPDCIAAIVSCAAFGLFEICTTLRFASRKDFKTSSSCKAPFFCNKLINSSGASAEDNSLGLISTECSIHDAKGLSIYNVRSEGE